MQEIVEGHRYVLSNFEKDETPGQVLQFIHKEPIEGLPSQLKTINNGTTNEEVLAVLIHRMEYLNKKFPCRENALAITNLEQALHWLEHRTKKRIAQGVEGQNLAHK